MARNIIFDWKFKDTIDYLDLIWNICLLHMGKKIGPEQISRKKNLVFWEIDNDVPGRVGVPIIKKFDRLPSKGQFQLVFESDMG